MIPSWAPYLVKIGDFANNFDSYREALYDLFHVDFVRTQPLFEEQSVQPISDPKHKGKEWSFWHIITEAASGNTPEDDRAFKQDRCERIKWPRCIIDNAPSTFKIWKIKEQGRWRHIIWAEEASFVVVLVERTGYFLLLTAYPVTYAHTAKKLEKQFQTHQK